MLISEKEQKANRHNVQSSTGPKTGVPSGSGKDAVRFNALTWGLRARQLLIGIRRPRGLSTTLGRAGCRVAAANPQ
jgi:hypothetical protein